MVCVAQFLPNVQNFAEAASNGVHIFDIIKRVSQDYNDYKINILFCPISKHKLMHQVMKVRNHKLSQVISNSIMLLLLILQDKKHPYDLFLSAQYFHINASLSFRCSRNYHYKFHLVKQLL